VIGPHPALSVGLATADPLHLGAELERLAAAGVGLVHLDVMDGVFCPVVATAAPSLARAIPSPFIVDVHLMIDDPLPKVADWVEAGAGIVTFQLEGARHPHRVLQSLADSGVVRGVAITPGTPLGSLEPLLGELELVLLLAVNPGWSGQPLTEHALDRLARVHELVSGGDVLVGFDGGVNATNVERVVDAGAQIVVAGSAIFDGGDAGANARAVLDRLPTGERV
jgi:ribulose-phosphate 3-epimerase